MKYQKIPTQTHGLQFEPNQKSEATIFWLHGLGASHQDFADLPDYFLPLAPKPTRFILPQAPRMPVTCNGGTYMPAWYDISALGPNKTIDYNGLLKSVKWLQAQIQLEIQSGIPSQAIILAGFSQGAVIAMLTSLICKAPLAGVIAASGYLPENIESKIIRQQPATLPILWTHGNRDQIIHRDDNRASLELIESWGYHQVTTQFDPHAAHTISAQQMQLMLHWQQQCLSQSE